MSMTGDELSRERQTAPGSRNRLAQYSGEQPRTRVPVTRDGAR